ncbi:hypothetical protein EV651_102346 [Kribbella sp. VKM Ac-2571]|uniref:hypothetical protein n=1 Tax=Kribbella sp. VKM Ac-2571 TaxID=2512222 RepID=UPI00105CDAEE|nr:hypothetical protein [Kribbella sp. VKM Ac-2571]TDO68425.1 hypothetical protein EV651_102346 [Kribbella sp. VKM Ac-2571]
MDVMPGRPEVFLLGEGERTVASGGPALVGAGGDRREVPPKAYDALRFVEAALREGFAVQITPLRTELPIDDAADAVDMDREELRLYASRGDLPFRSSQYVEWVQLADVLALSSRVDAERAQALQELAAEEPWDDDAGPRR